MVWENLKRLSAGYDGDIIIRIPVVPCFNANSEEIKKISAFISDIRCKSVELLPYHRMSEHKYSALNMPFTDYPLPKKEDIELYEKILK